MRIWTVHTLPESGAETGTAGATPPRRAPVALVREGFSWGAFLLGLVWLLWHRLWLAALGYLALGLAVALLLPAGGPVLAGSLALQFLLLGCHANDLRRRALARRGYAPAAVVAERDLDGATARLLAERPDLAARWTASWSAPRARAVPA